MSDKKNNILLSWSFLDPEPLQRSNRWFIIFGTIFGLLMVWALATFNWLFFIILLLSVVLILMRALTPSLEVPVHITERGIFINDELKRYRDMDFFWVAYRDDGASHLYLHFKSSWVPKIVIPINEFEPEQVGRIISEFVLEDVDQMEGWGDYLARVLRI